MKLVQPFDFLGTSPGIWTNVCGAVCCAGTISQGDNRGSGGSGGSDATAGAPSGAGEGGGTSQGDNRGSGGSGGSDATAGAPSGAGEGGGTSQGDNRGSGSDAPSGAGEGGGGDDRGSGGSGRGSAGPTRERPQQEEKPPAKPEHPGKGPEVLPADLTPENRCRHNRKKTKGASWMNSGYNKWYCHRRRIDGKSYCAEHCKYQAEKSKYKRYKRMNSGLQAEFDEERKKYEAEGLFTPGTVRAGEQRQMLCNHSYYYATKEKRLRTFTAKVEGCFGHQCDECVQSSIDCTEKKKRIAEESGGKIKFCSKCKSNRVPICFVRQQPDFTFKSMDTCNFCTYRECVNARIVHKEWQKDMDHEILERYDEEHSPGLRKGCVGVGDAKHCHEVGCKCLYSDFLQSQREAIQQMELKVELLRQKAMQTNSSDSDYTEYFNYYWETYYEALQEFGILFDWDHIILRQLDSEGRCVSQIIDPFERRLEIKKCDLRCCWCHIVKSVMNGDFATKSASDVEKYCPELAYYIDRTETRSAGRKSAAKQERFLSGQQATDDQRAFRPGCSGPCGPDGLSLENTFLPSQDCCVKPVIDSIFRDGDPLMDMNGLCYIRVRKSPGAMWYNFIAVKWFQLDHIRGERRGAPEPSKLGLQEFLDGMPKWSLTCIGCHRIKSRRNGDYVSFRYDFDKWKENHFGPIYCEKRIKERVVDSES